MEGTPEEVRTAAGGYVAYFGTYDVNEHEGTVTHHVHGSLFPNWVGRDQTRHYRFTGNRLTLSTPPMPVAGATVTGSLIWERAP